jgi:hypothetical protein
MAQAKKKSFVRFITPKGVAVYPKLNKPDEYKGKVFYACKLRMNTDNADVKEFVAKVQEQHAAGLEATREELTAKAAEEKDAKKKRKIADALGALELGPMPVKPVTLEDGTDSPNLVEVAFKMPATTKRDGVEMQQRPDLFDSTGKNKVNPAKVQVWGGSELKVAGFFYPYYAAATNGAGVSLRMSAVQIIKLVSSSNRDPGFGAEEGGYTAEEEGDANPFDGDGTPSGNNQPDGDAPKSGVNF